MTATVRTRGALPRRALIVGFLVTALFAAGPLAAHAQPSGGESYDVEFIQDRPVDGEHVHVVESGEYLSTIAADYGLDEASGWTVLFDANEAIDNPDLIHVGEEVVIPEEGQTLEARDLPEAVPAAAGGESQSSGAGDSSSGSSSESGSSSGSSGSSSESSGSEGASSSSSSSSPSSSSSSSSTSSDSGSSTSVGNGVWDRLAECESNGDWSINTGNGYYGGLQFDRPSWEWAGGGQYADLPHQATRSQQIAVAERLLEIHPAGWGAWPACSSQLGLR